MKFCSQCGASLRYSIPDGDDRKRYLCDACGVIHYQNPKIIAGTVPIWEGKVLLCKRAIEPRKGFWTLPAGFMELGETTDEAAIRETDEEANAAVDLQGLYTMYSLPFISQVHIFYRAELRSGQFSPGSESLETRLFDESEIPWDELSFETVIETLKCYFEDRRKGQFSLRVSGVEDEFKPAWHDK
jgi:ADP-ribose pyrophosphatase YjhB (NUDIX family)